MVSDHQWYHVNLSSSYQSIKGVSLIILLYILWSLKEVILCCRVGSDFEVYMAEEE